MADGSRAYEMARRFASAGHDVHVVTSSLSETKLIPHWTLQEVDGVTVHWIPVKYETRMGFFRRMSAFIAFALLAGWRARRLKADVVFATSTPLTIAIPGVLARRGRRSPMVFEVRDLWPEVPIAMGVLRHPLLKWAAHKLELFAYRNSDAVIALSPGMADGVAKLGVPRDRISVAPNACDNSRFDVPAEVGQAFRDERPWLGDRPLVVYAGSLSRANGVGYLAQLAHEVQGLDSEIRFLVVGGGGEPEAVTELAKEFGVLNKNFFMEGPRAKSSMPALLSAATLATSLFIPVKALEANSANKFFDALAAGKPIAINYGGWQAGLIKDNELGIVMDPTDFPTSAESLVTLLRSEPRLEKARKNARRLADGEFDRDRLTAIVLEVLEEAAGNTRP
ncbi:MAG: glycosyltransferase family 4 protein [Aeromicrobium sp.]